MTWVPAPELPGHSWLNPCGRELKLKDFRGRIPVMDFWSSKQVPSTPSQQIHLDCARMIIRR
jgi:hypothetical protein